MKRFSNLFEKTADFNSLITAAKKAAKGKHSSYQAIDFLFHMETNVIQLQKEIITGRYKPRPYRTFKVYEPKQRLICAADFRDRVVHHSVCTAMEPIFEGYSIFDSYACRKNKGTHKALKRAQQFLKKNTYFLKSDIRKFFDSIDYVVMKYLLGQKNKDHKMQLLMETIINHPVPGCMAGKGLPIGNLTSQQFANFYLGHLDHFIKDKLKIKYYIRYMDDFILFGNYKNKLKTIHEQIERYLSEILKLDLKPEGTLLSTSLQGLPFLGFRLYPNLVRIQKNGLKRFKHKLLRKISDYEEGKIDDLSLEQSLSSLVGHLKTADTLKLRQGFIGGINLRAGE